MRRAGRRTGNRGFILISSYLMLFVFFLYSTALTVQTTTQRMVADHTREELQALNLAQGTLEQLGDEFFQFLSVNVYQLTYQGDAIKALQWLDSLGNTITSGGSVTSTVSCAPCFSYEYDANGSLAMKSNFTGGTLDGVAANPRAITTLPTLKNAATDTARSWIVSIKNPTGDPLGKREMTVEGEATVGTTTKRIRAVYDIELGMSDIFRYAYFVNNYGWFNAGVNTRMYIRGDVRANGDVSFSGTVGNILVDGDLQASKNPELVNPVTKQPAVGTITGDPTQTASQAAYWSACDSYSCDQHASRPTLRVTVPGQPPVGGTEKILPAGKGWNSDSPDQKKAQGQATQPIPYLGNLSFYKSLAIQKGSKLTYYDSAAKQTKTITAVHDSDKPLVLVGTNSNPIVLNGPVVIPGDVIIKGVVAGRGTIYAGRNLHVVGQVTYKDPPHWRRVERNQVTGRIARRGRGTNFSDSESNLGTVCKSGAYYAPGAALPGGCM